MVELFVHTTNGTVFCPLVLSILWWTGYTAGQTSGFLLYRYLAEYLDIDTLAGYPVMEKPNIRPDIHPDMHFGLFKPVLRSRSRWSRNYFGTWSRK